MAVNKEHMRLLHTALMSSDYKQGKATLCRVADDGSKKWCCLGVATDVAIRNGLEVDVRPVDDRVEFDCSTSYLPPKVMAWYGFSNENPRFAGVKASTWNDTYGLPFQGIAELIAHEYKLFDGDD